MSAHTQALNAYKNRDFATALRIWEDEAYQQNDQALTNLGLMYLKGEGVKKELQKAKIYFEKGAALGNISAIYNLGLMYYSGIGMAENLEEGAKYLLQAAQAGHSGANFRMALHYLKDRTNQTNLTNGFACMLQAAKSGHPMANAQLMGLNESPPQEGLKNLPFRNKTFEKKLEIIHDALDRYIRPMLQKDGGDLILLECIDQDIIEIRLCYMGNCAGCSLASTSTYTMIKQTLQNVIDTQIAVYIL